ncbi:hypothetical protein K438DRAFT_1206535 [Mycena galopus ATCC 62051]|nr:hypothetical protein K438DRAFT_1206535 [Mycena galopus ATCC 62051]
MSRTIEEIKSMCPRFRILVMGRRNAGKTTILKKMCRSDGSDLKIIDPAGNEVDPSILEPNRQRGMSDIENEITFGSNPLFVFHDSRGLKLEPSMKTTHHCALSICGDFFASAQRLRDSGTRYTLCGRFCIPMNDPRAPSEFEVAFFNAEESHVPIIAVFTKFESWIDAAYDDLPQDDSTDTEQAQRARQAAQSKFEETVLKVIENTKYPPNQFVQLQNLDEPATGCEGLTEKTYTAIEEETLGDLFALAQTNSFRVGCNRILGSIV